MARTAKNPQRSRLQLPPEYAFDAVEREIRWAIGQAGKAMPGGEEGVYRQVAQDTGIPYNDLGRRLKRSEEKTPSGKVTRRKFLTFEQVGLIAQWVSDHYRPTPQGWPIMTFAMWERTKREILTRANEATRENAKAE